MESEVDGVLVVAHELKAPLAVIRQLAFALGELKSENEQIRSEMIQVSERAIKQVNDLAKVRRLEDGLFVMEPVSVRAVCDDVFGELVHLYNGEQKNLLVKYSNRARLVTANRDLLRSVVYNFVVNAMHYSDDGTRAELLVRDSKENVRITVRDYGPSLPLNIWRKFKEGQLDEPAPIAMRSGSSGLGLYIASEFSKYMHGKLGAVRHHDGTSFFVELPVSKQASLFA